MVEVSKVCSPLHGKGWRFRLSGLGEEMKGKMKEKSNPRIYVEDSGYTFWILGLGSMHLFSRCKA